MHQMEAKGNRRAGLVNRLREDQDHMIGTILLGIVGSLVGGTLASVLAGDGFEIYRIGDAVSSRNIHAATLDAFRLCRTL